MKLWDKLSLRTRLTLLHSGLLALIVCILGVTFFIDTRNLLIENTASHLRARAKPIIEHWLYGQKNHLPTSDDLKQIAKSLARDLTSRNTVALILDKHGKTIANGKMLPEEPSPPSPNPVYYSQALAGKNEVNYIISQSNHHTLVILIPLRQTPTSQKIIGVVQLSSPLTSVEQTLFYHGLYLATGALITLFMGFGLGFLLTSSALRGLKRVINICQEISKGNLNLRVNLPKRQDEIGQLAHAFDKMVECIESTFEAQRRFVANAAHELRTPLTVLRGSLDVLLRGSQDDPAAVTRLSQGMYQEVTRLARLCDQLLDLAKLETSTKIQKRPLNLNDFFKNFITQAQLLTQGRRIVLREGPFVTLVVDPDMLKQILFNLLYNAIQHTDETGTITLGWKLTPNQVEIWIADNGEGISPQDLPHIFEPFYRGKNVTSKRIKGTGLGLTLVKSMVEAHNGYIKVDSQLGKGTVFTFRLPLN